MKGIKLIVLVCFIICWGYNGYTQTDSVNYTDDEEKPVVPDVNPDGKAGIKMGIMFHTIAGTENTANTLALGMCGGGYYRQKLAPKSWLQAELFISFRGGNFKASALEYEKIRLLYLDLPLLYLKSFKNIQHKYFIGIQTSYLVSPTVYIKNQSLPLTGQINLNRFDALPVIGYQYHLPFLTLQTCVKYGLINLNNGYECTQNTKPLNNGGTMHNIAAEFNILF